VARHCLFIIGKKLQSDKTIGIYIAYIDRYLGYRRAYESSDHSQISINPIVEMTSNETQTIYLSDELTNDNQLDEPSTAQHITLTFILWIFVLSIALIANNLGVVLAVTGSVAGSMLGYVLPGAIYLKSYESDVIVAYNSIRSNELNMIDKWNQMRRFIIPMIMIIFGFLSLILGLTTIIITN